MSEKDLGDLACGIEEYQQFAAEHCNGWWGQPYFSWVDKAGNMYLHFCGGQA